jgi:asparagine synthase (glutamine-hydrolysing)
VPALSRLDGEVLDPLRSAMSAPAARRRGVLEIWLQQHGIG